MNAQLKIRLLNEELNGREIALPEGIFTLGDQKCDILLPLEGGQILTLKIVENQVSMQAQGRVWVNGLIFNLQNSLPFH